MAEGETATGGEGPTTRAFEAEVSRLLHLMVHSVYSNRDVFLRELISNAADACERLRTLSSVGAGAGGRRGAVPHRAVRRQGRRHADGRGQRHRHGPRGADRQSRHDRQVRHPRLPRKPAGERRQEHADRPVRRRLLLRLHGGASEVEVTSRRAGSDEAWRWRSDGKGSYSVEAAALDQAPARGTRVVHHASRRRQGLCGSRRPSNGWSRPIRRMCRCRSS